MVAKDWNRALVLVRETLAEEPNSPTLNLWHAAILEALDRYEDAIAVYRQMPDGPIVWEGLCRDLIQVQRLDDAQTACELSIAHKQGFRGSINLGHVHLLRGDQESAYRWYGDAVVRMANDHESIDGALADFNNFIQRDWRTQNVREAAEWFANSYNHILNSGTQIALAFFEQLAGNYEKSIELLERALSSYENILGNSHEKLAAVLSMLASANTAIGANEKSEQLLSRIIKIYEAKYSLDYSSIISAKNDLAMTKHRIGKHQEALLLLRQSLETYPEGTDLLGRAEILNNIAFILEDAGEFGQAQSAYSEAIALADSLGTSGAATSLSIRINASELQNKIGNHEAALSVLNGLVDEIDKAYGKNSKEMARTLNGIASANLEKGDLDAALASSKLAVSISEKFGRRHDDQYAKYLLNLAAVYFQRHELDKSISTLNVALSVVERMVGEDGVVMAAIYNNRGAIQEIIGDIDSARHSFEHSIYIQSRNNIDPINLAVAEGNLAGLFARSNNLDVAIYVGKSAVNRLQYLRGKLANSETTLFVKRHEHYYNALAGWLIDAGRLAEAEQVMAMLKEKELNDLLRSNGTDLRRTQADFVGPERKALAELRELEARGVQDAAELARLEARRKQGATLNGEETARLAALQAAAATWRADYQRYLAKLGELLTQARRSGEDRVVAAETTQLQKRVALDPAGAVGLHYVVTDQRISIIVATPRASFGRWSAIPRKALDADIASLRQAIVKRQDVAHAARRLWQALIAPVAADLQAAGATTLVLSLTDNLRYLPFAALQDENGRYLVQEYALSTWAGAAGVEPQASRQPWNVAGMGLTQARFGFPALPAVRDELAAIVHTSTSPAGVLPGAVALDEQFSRSRLDAAVGGGHNVLHVASHFDFQLGNEQGSKLILGEGEPISLAQMAVMNFQGIEQVTLSACQTAYGGGGNENGREVEGLAAVVQNSGAQAVLASLWKVADDSTARLMQQFYAQRARPEPVGRAQALRHAQLTLIEGQAGSGAGAATERAAVRKGAAPPVDAAPVDPARPYAHPFYWAPFVLSGNWM